MDTLVDLLVPDETGNIHVIRRESNIESIERAVAYIRSFTDGRYYIPRLAKKYNKKVTSKKTTANGAANVRTDNQMLIPSDLEQDIAALVDKHRKINDPDTRAAICKSVQTALMSQADVALEMAQSKANSKTPAPLTLRELQRIKRQLLLTTKDFARNVELMGLVDRANALDERYAHRHRHPWLAGEKEIPNTAAMSQWLDEVFPDRTMIGLVLSDLRRLDSSAYRKILNWSRTTSNISVEAIRELDVPSKKAPSAPTQISRSTQRRMPHVT